MSSPADPRPRGRLLGLGAADLGLALVLVLGGLNFLWQLGSSSLFIDEAYSIEQSVPALGEVLHQVRTQEVTPWTYFVFLHEWIGRTGSQAEWVARLPSALAGVVLVGAVFWMASAFLPRWAALLAAALCALSPLVLEYAQEVRAYVFVMLAATVAVGLTVRAAEPGRSAVGRRRLLAAGCAAAILAFWLHYSAAFVVGPLCVWLWLQSGTPRGERTAYIGAWILGAVVLVPLFVSQVHNGGLGPAAGANWGSVLELAETPFDRRAQSEFDPRTLGVGVLDAVGVAIVVLSVALVLWPRAIGPRGEASGSVVRHRGLLVALALCAIPLLILLGLAGKDVVNKRYAAVAVPFVITLIAGGAARWRRAGPLLAAAALAACLAGSVESHAAGGFYYPARQAIADVSRRWSPGDVIVAPADRSAFYPLQYYARLRLHPAPVVVPGDDGPAISAAIRQRRRVWFIADVGTGRRSRSAVLRYASRLLAPDHYRPVQLRSFTTVSTFTVLLATPDR